MLIHGSMANVKLFSYLCINFRHVQVQKRVENDVESIY